MTSSERTVIERMLEDLVDRDLKVVVKSDFEEFVTLHSQNDVLKSTLAIGVAVVEGLLLDMMIANEPGVDIEEMSKMYLADLAKKAQTSDLIEKKTKDSIDLIRDRRNFLHPGRCFRDDKTVSSSQKNLIVTVLLELAEDRHVISRRPAEVETLSAKLDSDYSAIGEIGFVSNLIPSTHAFSVVERLFDYQASVQIDEVDDSRVLDRCISVAIDALLRKIDKSDHAEALAFLFGRIFNGNESVRIFASKVVKESPSLLLMNEPEKEDMVSHYILENVYKTYQNMGRDRFLVFSVPLHDKWWEIASISWKNLIVAGMVVATLRSNVPSGLRGLHADFKKVSKLNQRDVIVGIVRKHMVGSVPSEKLDSLVDVFLEN